MPVLTALYAPRRTIGYALVKVLAYGVASPLPDLLPSHLQIVAESQS